MPVPVISGRMRAVAPWVVRLKRTSAREHASRCRSRIWSSQVVYGAPGLFVRTVGFGSLEACRHGRRIPDRFCSRGEEIRCQHAILRLEVAASYPSLDHFGDDTLEQPDMFAEGRPVLISRVMQRFTMWQASRKKMQAEAILIQNVINELFRRFDRPPRICSCNRDAFFEHSDDGELNLLCGGQGVVGMHVRNPE